MRDFLAILLLITLALLATSPRLYRLRRKRPIVVLISGGWLAIGAGFLLGPHGSGLIGEGAWEVTPPLLMVGLGWIGVMVGLQLRREVLRNLPATVPRMTLIDAVVSAALFGGVAAGGLALMSTHSGEGVRLVGPAVLIACASIGWSMETRSLRTGADDPGSDRVAMLVRATGALGGVVGVTLFGLLGAVAEHAPGETPEIDPLGSAIRVVACLALAVGLGVVGRWGLQLAGRSRDQQLVVFLGIVAFVAGIAVQFRIAPLFAAMVVGAVIANLPGGDLRRFEQFILKAEHVVAALFGLLAGVLLSPNLGAPELALALAIAALRLFIKPLIFRLGSGGDRGAATPVDMSAGSSALMIGAVRQHPLAIAMGVTAYLLEPSEALARLLTVIVLAGFLSDLIPLGMSLFIHRQTGETATPRPGEPEPAA